MEVPNRLQLSRVMTKPGSYLNDNIIEVTAKCRQGNVLLYSQACDELSQLLGSRASLILHVDPIGSPLITS